MAGLFKEKGYLYAVCTLAELNTNWGGKQDLVLEAAAALLLEICRAEQQVQINYKFPVILYFFPEGVLLL